MKGGKVEIITNDQGNRITPSYVAWNDEERLVGDSAKNQFASNPHRTVFDIKSVSLCLVVRLRLLTNPCKASHRPSLQ